MVAVLTCYVYHLFCSPTIATYVYTVLFVHVPEFVEHCIVLMTAGKKMLMYPLTTCIECIGGVARVCCLWLIGELTYICTCICIEKLFCIANVKARCAVTVIRQCQKKKKIPHDA